MMSMIIFDNERQVDIAQTSVTMHRGTYTDDMSHAVRPERSRPETFQPLFAPSWRLHAATLPEENRAPPPWQRCLFVDAALCALAEYASACAVSGDVRQRVFEIHKPARRFQTAQKNAPLMRSGGSLKEALF